MNWLCHIILRRSGYTRFAATARRPYRNTNGVPQRVSFGTNAGCPGNRPSGVPKVDPKIGVKLRTSQRSPCRLAVPKYCPESPACFSARCLHSRFLESTLRPSRVGTTSGPETGFEELGRLALTILARSACGRAHSRTEPPSSTTTGALSSPWCSSYMNGQGFM